MYKLTVVFLIALSAQAIFGSQAEFDKELKKISSIVEKDFDSLDDLKKYVDESIAELVEDAEGDDESLNLAIVKELEDANQILKQVHGPEDLDKLKEFRKALQKVVNDIEIVLNAMFEGIGKAIEEAFEELLNDITKAMESPNSSNKQMSVLKNKAVVQQKALLKKRAALLRKRRAVIKRHAK